jgi:tRNA-binding EMAP/Myf-like protein
MESSSCSSVNSVDRMVALSVGAGLELEEEVLVVTNVLLLLLLLKDVVVVVLLAPATVRGVRSAAMTSASMSSNSPSAVCAAALAARLPVFLFFGILSGKTGRGKFLDGTS